MCDAFEAEAERLKKECEVTTLAVEATTVAYEEAAARLAEEPPVMHHLSGNLMVRVILSGSIPGIQRLIRLLAPVRIWMRLRIRVRVRVIEP